MDILLSDIEAQPCGRKKAHVYERPEFFPANFFNEAAIGGFRLVTLFEQRFDEFEDPDE